MSRIHEALKRAEREKSRPRLPEATAERPDAAPSAAAAAPAPIAPPVSQSTVAVPAPPPPQTKFAAVQAAAAAAPATVPPPASNLPAPLHSCRRAHWHEDVSKLFFLSGKGFGIASEQLRTLRSRLYQFREARPLRSVLVTSAMPGEGKTFICANLAYAFARQSDRRILLIDADIRSPAVHSLLGAPREPGLTSYLQGDSGLEQILQVGPHENLFLIPAGKPAQNPADLVATGKLKSLLAELAPLFDWILLDSPAAAPVSDALQIAGWCDGVLLVVQGGKTPYDLAQGVTRELREKRLLGVVLNRTEPSSVTAG